MAEQQLLETAIEAARAGGQIALANFRQPQKVGIKGMRDFIPEAALKVQDRIEEIIGQAFPDHRILAEEGGKTSEIGEGYQWLVDPIDGSTNYARGLPFFAVSVALWRGTRPLIGVVFDPYHDDLFRAQKGGRAFLNDKPLQVVSTEEHLDVAVVGTDWPRAVDKRAEHSKTTDIMLREVITLRPLGSPALGICYVAAGYLDAYYHLSLEKWDVAAAAVILEEAGGELSDELGGYWIYSTGGYVAANKSLHKQVIRLMPK
jgi:myo-inositol-1(or 4)-monophosphatase